MKSTSKLLPAPEGNRPCSLPYLGGLCLLGLALAAGPLSAVTQTNSNPDSIRWVKGPDKVTLRNSAELAVPKGTVFLDEPQTKVLLTNLGRHPSGRELGIILAESEAWSVIIEDLDFGHVSDQAWQSLDAASLLQAVRRTEEQANLERSQDGHGSVFIQGWRVPPVYDPAAHRLEWAIEAASGGQTVVNHAVAALGRKGALRFILVARERPPSTLSAFRDLVSGLTFKSGERYTDYRPGEPAALGGLGAAVIGKSEAVTARPRPLGPSRLKRFAWAVEGGSRRLGGALRQCWWLLLLIVVLPLALIGSYKLAVRVSHHGGLFRLLWPWRRGSKRRRLYPSHDFYLQLTRDVYRKVH